MSYERGERYVCSVCKRSYAWNWIKRHMVRTHEWRYWDNDDIYDPAATGEKIVSSAVRSGGTTRVGGIATPVAAYGEDERATQYGFLTDKGRFVDRREAMIIAVAANQLPTDFVGYQLYIEDLY